MTLPQTRFDQLPPGTPTASDVFPYVYDPASTRVHKKSTFTALMSTIVSLLKAIGSEVTTGTEDAKFITPKALKDASIVAVAAASEATAGKVELATSAEINTGTDNTRAISPDSLAGSNAGTRIAYVQLLDPATSLSTGDGKGYWTVPQEFNGMNLVSAQAAVYTVSSSGAPTFMVHNLTDTVDMLSTAITIDASEYSSYTATTASVVDAAHDEVATGDRIRFDCDGAGTGTKGMDIILSFRLP